TSASVFASDAEKEKDKNEGSPTVPIKLLVAAADTKRPAGLTALYASYATLQALDVVSTRKAIAAGGHEVNPIMGTGGTARIVAVKAAMGAMTVYLAEKAWRKNRTGAI